MPSLAILRLIALGIALAAAAAAGGWMVHGYYAPRLKALQSNFDVFRGGVAALGKAAQDRAAAQQKADLAKKEAADRENARTVSDLNRRIAGMRNAINAGRGGLSAPAASASDPSRTCFDPAGLADALQSLDRGVLGLVEEGAKAVTDLDTAKEWAR